MQKYIIDTNYILRYLLADNIKQYEESKTFFEGSHCKDIKLQLSREVFAEVIFVLRSFYEVPIKEIADTMKSLLTYKHIECDKILLMSALDIYVNHNIHIVDSILAAEAKEYKINVLTYDKKLKAIVNNFLTPSANS